MMAIKNTKNRSVNNSTDDMSVNVISITEDSLRVILIDHVRKLRKSKDIIGAVALVIALLTVLITSDFKDRGFDPNTWYGIFIVLFAASVVYLGFVICSLIKNWDSVDKIMDDIRQAKGGASTDMVLPTPIKQPKKNSKHKDKKKKKK